MSECDSDVWAEMCLVHTEYTLESHPHVSLRVGLINGCAPWWENEDEMNSSVLETDTLAWWFSRIAQKRKRNSQI